MGALNSKIDLQNQALFKTNPGLFQRDMSSLTDEQIISEGVPKPSKEFLKEIRSKTQKAGFETARKLGADIPTALSFAQSISEIAPFQQRDIGGIVSALMDNGMSI